jgi:formate--tetrahydrofolate ligase
MASDIEIARAARLKPIAEIAAKIGAPESALRPFGRFIAKLEYDFLSSLSNRPDGKLILSGDPAQPGGRGQDDNHRGWATPPCIGEDDPVCEPSLGPSFGMKGGATGGGTPKFPMDEINLHFTGDFHAITSAHNLLRR